MFFDRDGVNTRDIRPSISQVSMKIMWLDTGLFINLQGNSVSQLLFSPIKILQLPFYLEIITPQAVSHFLVKIELIQDILDHLCHKSIWELLDKL